MKTTPIGKAAQAAFSVPVSKESDWADELSRRFPTDAIVKMRRPDGREYLLRVPGEHLDRLIEIAGNEFEAVVEALGGR